VAKFERCKLAFLLSMQNKLKSGVFALQFAQMFQELAPVCSGMLQKQSKVVCQFAPAIYSRAKVQTGCSQVWDKVTHRHTGTRDQIDMNQLMGEYGRVKTVFTGFFHEKFFTREIVKKLSHTIPTIPRKKDCDGRICVAWLSFCHT